MHSGQQGIDQNIKFWFLRFFCASCGRAVCGHWTIKRLECIRLKSCWKQELGPGTQGPRPSRAPIGYRIEPRNLQNFGCFCCSVLYYSIFNASILLRQRICQIQSHWTLYSTEESSPEKKSITLYPCEIDLSHAEHIMDYPVGVFSNKWYKRSTNPEICLILSSVVVRNNHVESNIHSVM